MTGGRIFGVRANALTPNILRGLESRRDAHIKTVQRINLMELLCVLID